MPVDHTKKPEIPDGWITCEYEVILSSTGKAVLVKFSDDVNDRHWLPKQFVIFHDETIHKGGRSRYILKKISMPEWLYKDKGL